MALQFINGFDYFDQTQKSRLFDYSLGGTSLIPGRFGGRGYVFNNESGYLVKVLTASTTMVLGMALSFSYGDPTNPFLIFQDGTASRTSPITQVDVRVTNDGAFQFTRNGSVIATSGPYLITFGSWNYMEVKVTISSSGGVIILRLNGQTFMTQTGLNTQTSGNNYVNQVRIQPFSASGNYNFRIDDVCILDNSGPSPQNDFLGECRVQTQWPSANGDTNQFSTVGALTNYQAVDETISDGDTSYVKSGTVGYIDDYTMGTVNLTGTIYGVQVNLTQRKDDVGVRSICPVIKSGGTFYEGNAVACGSDYAVTQKIWPLEPYGAAAWTNASVNAMTAGIKIKG